MSDITEMRNEIVDKVQDRVDQMTSEGELHLPDNYSPENALKSAWLILQDTKTSNKKPVLSACDKSSIANALLKMITMGLNPEKKQCYFIPYGSKLVCQPSYFGSIKVAKQAADVKEVYPQCIYEGDEIETEIVKGTEKITKHKRKFQNKINGEVVGAYAVVEFDNDKPDNTEIMTIEQIENAWKQGQTYKEGGNGTHQKFTEEMAKKTVINRACKRAINSSDDSNLMINAFNEPGEVQAEQEVQEEIEENANSEVIDIESPREEKPEQEEQEPEPEPETEKEQKGQEENDSGNQEGPGF